MDALRHVHAVGFVHMDVKEANVLVDAAGCWAPGDFGSAVREGEAIVSTTRGLHTRLVWAEDPRETEPHFDFHVMRGGRAPSDFAGRVPCCCCPVCCCCSLVVSRGSRSLLSGGQPRGLGLVAEGGSRDETDYETD